MTTPQNTPAAGDQIEVSFIDMDGTRSEPQMMSRADAFAIGRDDRADAIDAMHAERVRYVGLGYAAQCAEADERRFELSSWLRSMARV